MHAMRGRVHQCLVRVDISFKAQGYTTVSGQSRGPTALYELAIYSAVLVCAFL